MIPRFRPILSLSIVLAAIAWAVCSVPEACRADENGEAPQLHGAKAPVASKPKRDESPLWIEIVPASNRMRSHAPMPVDVKLLWRGKELLDGRLEVVFRFTNPSLGQDRQTLFRWRNEFSLTPGTRTTRVWLPAVEAPHALMSLEAESRFVTTKGKEIPLRKAEFKVPTRGKLDGLIAVVHPDGRPNDGGDYAVLHQLQWEAYTTHDEPSSPVVTTLAFLPLGEAPTRGLQYLAYDIVVVTPGALKELRPKQVDALVQWAEGGGSVLAMLDRPVDAKLHGLLNRLAGGADRIPRDDDDDSTDGDALPGDAAKGGAPGAAARPRPTASLRMFHPGIGRFALLRGPVDASLFATEESWRDAALFLWKATAKNTETVRNGDKLPLVRRAQQRSDEPAVVWTEPQIRPRLQSQSAADMAPRRTIAAADLVDMLMSSSVASLSLASTAGILALFVLAIGPFDWFVLGWLRRRPLTWILLPLTSIVFLVLTMRWAQARLGSADVRRSLIVVDMGEDGRVVRRSRFELMVAGQAKIAEFDATNAFVVPFPPGAEPTQGHTRASPRDEVDLDDVPRNSDRPEVWSGIPPNRSTMSRALRQWSPRLNRHTSFESDAALAPPRAFQEVTRTAVEARGGGGAAARRLRADDADSAVMIYRQASMLIVDRTGAEFTATGDEHGPRPAVFLQLIDAMTVAPQVTAGLFFLSAQRSPAAAARFDDLVLHDTTDPRQTTVVQVVPRGDDWIVFRKVFHAPAEGH